jgi:sarcosine oxidase
MANTFDVIVIGVGAMGASTCFHLARRGIKTLGLEQFDIPHARGSSHGDSRMIRKAYYEHPGYVPLLHRAYALWDELEAMSRTRVLHRVGGLFMGPRDGALVGGALAAAELHHLPHELLAAHELGRRWPQFVVPDSWHGFYEPESGFLLPEKAISAYAELAMRDGAEIHGQEPVRQWKREQSHFIVRTDFATYAAEKLIFCGGAWSAKLLDRLNLRLKVTRQVLGWVWPKQPQSFELGQIPAWGIDSLDGGMHYGFPMIQERPGFKLAHHMPSEKPFDPDTISREAQPADRDEVRNILTTFIPTADGPLLSLKICLYTNTPDGHFIIDEHPDHPGVQIACGFSGHGFKFSSAIGAVLAEASIDGRRDASLDFLRLARFGFPPSPGVPGEGT